MKNSIFSVIVFSFIFTVVNLMVSPTVMQAESKEAKIVFTRSHLKPNFDAQMDIYVMDIHGKNIRNITNHPADDRAPNWSPDGEWIVFSSGRNGSSNEIHVMKPDGSNVKGLGVSGIWAAWSPNGEWIAFTGSDQANQSILQVMKADGSGVRTLWRGELTTTTPWSPDSQWLVFEAWAPHGGIAVIDINGQNFRFVTGGKGKYPVWSPDGKQIAFQKFVPIGEEWGEHIFVVDVDDMDGKNLKKLTRGKAAYYQPHSWTPDGKIAFFCGKGLCIMDAEGNNTREFIDLRKTLGDNFNYVSLFGSIPDRDSSTLNVSPVKKKMVIWGEIKKR